MRKLASITLIVIFSSIYYYSSVKDENSLAFQLKKEVKEVVSALKPVKVPEVASEDASSDMPQKETAQGASPEFSGDLGSLNEEQLDNWLRQQSASLDMTNNDAKEIEIKLRASANTLKPEQLGVLGAKVLDANVPANQRILAAYVLTLNPTASATAAQFDVAKEPLPELGLPLPHSEAELRRTQELALRYMEVDQLAERAKTDANARDKLKLLLNDARSEEVRNYVARKIKDLSL